jgi:hypothetical protein
MKSAKHHQAHLVAIRQSEPLEDIYRQANELTRDLVNPRRHSRKQVRQIQKYQGFWVQCSDPGRS